MRDAYVSFSNSIRQIESSRVKLENLSKRKLISNADLFALYEGLYIGLVTGFEKFLETLFLQIMLQKKTYASRDVKPRITVKSPVVLNDILLATRAYIDWLPYDRTEERARIFLRSGRPFSDIADSDKFKLQQITWIRNATVHASSYAMDKFRQNVIGSLSVRPQEKKPAGFLRSQMRISPSTTRFQYYATEILRIAHDLSS